MWKLLLPGLMPRFKRGPFTDAQALMAVPFNSDRPNGTADSSNYAIAEILAGLHKKLGLPIVVQRENARVLRESFGIEPAHVYDTKPGQWVKTDVFVRWAARRIGRGARVVVVGHPHHVKRVAALAEHFGLAPIVDDHSHLVPYDPDGGQWWTRSATVYLPWEYLSRAVLLLKWLVLGFRG